jgi:hypothetical protein
MKTTGHDGFSKDYWEKNYSNPKEMDGIGNVKDHFHYIKSFFNLDYVDISSVIDFGAGLGHMFAQSLTTFIPHTAVAIEPSEYAFDQLKKKATSKIETMNITIKKIDLLTWCREHKNSGVTFDLGICTSVFQYMSEAEIKEVLPLIAKRVKYLYFSVPTDLELKQQIDDLEFHDEYALRRSRNWYLKTIRPYFTFVSSRVLESKFHFSENTTSFTDLLFRY